MILFVLIFSSLFGFLLNIRLLQKEEKGREIKFLTIFSYIIAFIYVFGDVNIETILGILLIIAISYCNYYNKTWIKYVTTSYFTYFLLTIWTETNINAQYYSCPSTIILFLLLHICLSTFINEKISFILLNASILLLRFVNIIYASFRYGNITIMDILSIPTAITIIEEYEMTFKANVYILIGILIVAIFLYCKNIKSTKINKKQLKYIIPSILINLMIINGYSKMISEKQGIIYLNGPESLISSTINEITFKLKFIDKNHEKNKIIKFQDDEIENMVQPNIICILNESFSDVQSLLNLTSNKDALESFKKLESDNCKIGTVDVDTFGGGTSKSEWEFLTGLDIKKFSEIQIPFLGKCNKNYAFTSNDNVYKNYELSFIHPYSSVGWNRNNVYKNFGYKNIYFYDELSNEVEFFDSYVSDDSIYKKSINIIKENENPQFIKIVTMQNHGGYTDRNLPKNIEIKENIKNKEEIEDFLTLMEHSSEAINELVKYLEEHKEEPTLLIFYGDHYPGGLFDDRSEAVFHTPYLVYSNFGNINEIPNNLDLSLLYPYAKAAAGLPMTAYEKYLLSLNGETVSSDFITARIKHGAFELK